MAKKTKKTVESNNPELVIDKNPITLNPLKCRNQKQKFFRQQIKDHDIVIADGIAGSGKTFIALYEGVYKLLCKKFDKVILCKSVVSTPDQEIGFIPGPQPLDSMCVTPNGWKQFGDLKIGDEITAHDGTPTIIENIYPKGKKDVYKITLSDGRSTECCEDHVWTIYDGWYRGYKDVNTKYIIENIDKRPMFLPLHGIVKYNTYNELPLDPYVVGVFIGDGVISGSHVRFASNDKFISDYITEYSKNFNLKVTKNKQNIIYTISNGRNHSQSGCREIARKNILTGDIEVLGSLKNSIKLTGLTESTIITRIKFHRIIDGYEYFYTGNILKSENYIKESLISLNLMGKRAWEKRIPREYLYSSVEDRISLLQGLMDTDGNAHINRNDLTYTTTSCGLAHDIKELILSLGGTATVHERIRHDDNFIGNQKVISRRPLYEVSICLYNDNFIPFKLERKRKLFKPKLYYRYATRVKNIEYVGIKEVQCIKISHQDSLYLTDNFIVTHNTVEEKMNPHIMSYKGNLEKMVEKGDENVKRLFNDKKIEVLPLAYIRGVTLDNSYIIIDEAQNISIELFKSIITRIGENSKMIFLGDIEQVDFDSDKKRKQSALQHIINIFQNDPDVATVHFEDDECVRNPIIPKILNKLRDFEKTHNKKGGE